MGIHQICDLIGSSEEKICVATSGLLCNIINSMTNVEAFQAKVKEQAKLKKKGERVKPVQFEMGMTDAFLLLYKIQAFSIISSCWYLIL